MKRILIVLFLCLLAPAIFAAPNFFTPSDNDQSMYYLAALFGHVGNVIPQPWAGIQESTLLKYAFLYFNNGVIVLGCILILYSLVVGTINTSHHGEMMGQKWNSVWIPLRSAMGFALLLPVTSATLDMKGVAVQGYAVIQVFVMWVIVQGVGAADYIWANMVDKVGSGDAGISIGSTTNDDLETATNIFQYLTCSIAYMETQQSKNYYTQEKTPSRNVKIGSKGKNNYSKTYQSTTPYIGFQNTNGVKKANMPNTYVWSFGSYSPSDWDHRAICGYITLPTGGESSDSDNSDSIAARAYFTAQKDLINNMIGYSNALANRAMGVYGGNWLGIYLSNGLPPFPNSNANGATGFVPGDGNQYPTLGYLADVYMVYLDTGSSSTGPGGSNGEGTSGSETADDGTSCTDANGNTYYVTLNDDGTSYSNQTNTDPTIEDSTPKPGCTAPSSNAEDYVTAQLGLVAAAYQAATQKNYQAYQDAKDSSDPDNPDSPNIRNQEKKANLMAAAQYNGWASAGSFFLDMAKVLNTWVGTISATSNDYSYSTLACQRGVGITDAGANRRCQDARSAPDIKGDFRSYKKDTHNAYGYSAGNSLSAVLTGGEMMGLSVLGSIEQGDTDTCTPQLDENGEVILDPTTGNPICAEQITPSCTALTDDNGRIIQQCGIYNSARSDSSAFDPAKFKKPHWPYGTINPLGWFHYVNGMIMYNFAQTLKPIMDMGKMGGQMTNPLFVLRKAGLRMLITSSKLYHIGFRYMWISGLVSYPFSGFTGIANAMTSALTWGATMYTALIGIMMTMGAVMAYYFPMIPYLVFTFAFIQWLILTIEAMAAAPLLSLGILNPEGGHEVFGQSSAGIAILSSLFLRPSLMIIGYFAATVMSYVVVLVVNAGFFFAANALLGTMDSKSADTASMFGVLLIWGMYVNTLMVVLNKAFSLIYHIPDHITRWIGINEERGDVENMMSSVKSGVEKGADTGKSMADSQMAARKQSMQDYAKGMDELKSKIKGA